MVTPTLLPHSPRPDAAFWQGKRVLITGHTGFKGSWLALWLHQLGAQVMGLALAPNSKPSLFELAGIEHLLDHRLVDIQNAADTQACISQFNPHIVLHLAAQALVRPSYQTPLATFQTNVMGTAHVLEAIRHCPATQVAVMVTTDKVYRNLENGQAYVETDALGGHDPYSASKAACELVIQSYQQSFLAAQGVAVASARAGNVMGGGDWSVDRLVPDAVKAWQQQQPLAIRNPHAVRPWQHVLEPLHGYLCLAQALWHQPHLAGSYNFGPHSHEAASVAQVLQLAAQHWSNAQVNIAPTDPHAPHEANLLMLNTQKAQQQLGLQPQWGLSKAIERTIGWYHQLHLGANALDLCLDDLRLFTNPCDPS